MQADLAASVAECWGFYCLGIEGRGTISGRYLWTGMLLDSAGSSARSADCSVARVCISQSVVGCVPLTKTSRRTSVHQAPARCPLSVQISAETIPAGGWNGLAL